MPFTAIGGKATPQYLIGIGSMLASFIGVYLLAKRFKFSHIDSLWLALFFVFSTVLFGASVINITAYQVQAMQVPFIVFALVEYFSKKRPLVIGILVGLALMTRFTQILAVVFFFVEFLQKRMTMKQFLFFLLPVIVACLLIGGYNQRRFDYTI
jgi:4-amino-4-deoxy-L-arabinose transferase-like glycosyltransferase